jgi:probable F420-dependent oxidoreductase
VAAAASVTTTLRHGPMTVNNDLWNPAVLARDAGSAGQLSDGRVELGIGAGWRSADYTVAGVAEDPPGVRIARLEAAIATIRRCWSEGELSPVQERVPVFVGGGGRRILRVAATAADIVGVHVNLGGRGVAIGRRAPDRGDRPPAAAPDDRGVSEGSIAARLAWIAADRPAAFAAPELHLYVLDVRPGPSAVEAAAAPAAAYGIPPDAVVASPWFLTGPDEEMARKLTTITERYGITYFTVGEEHMDTLHRVMAHL